MDKHVLDIEAVVVVKSLEGGDKEPDKDYIQMKIEGVASTEDPDVVGEVMIQAGIDPVYVEKGFARIKNEHSKDPKDNIGFLNNLSTEGKKTFFKGVIYAKKGTVQYPVAKSVIDDIVNVQSHNELNPNNPKKVGWSLEGAGLKQGVKILKLIVSNLVYTRNPQNFGASLTAFAKSLDGGGPANYSGGDSSLQDGVSALRPEQLIDHKENSMDFKSFNEAYSHFLKQGHKPDEARKMATEAWDKISAERKSQAETAAKALVDVTKSAEALTATAKTLRTTADEAITAGNTSYQKVEKSLGKYVDAGTPNEERAGHSLDVIAGGHAMTRQAIDLVSKGQISNAEAFDAIGSIFQNIAKSLESIVARQDYQDAMLASLSDGQSALFQASMIQMQGRGLSSPALDQLAKSLPIDASQNGAPVPVSRTVILDTLEAGVQEGKVTGREIVNFSTGGGLTSNAENYLISKGIKIN